MVVYYPSCNFTQVSPETTKHLKRYLEEAHGIKAAGCCRPGHKALTREDTALTICLTCTDIIRENAEAKVCNIFEFLDRAADFPWPNYQGEKMVLQDCWRTRNEKSLQNAVRSILKKCNVEIVELEENRENSRFCGTFRYNPMLERNILIAPHTFGEGMEGQLELHTPEEQQKLMEEHAKTCGPCRVVAYCNSCLRGLKQGGARGVHLMELLFPNTQTSE